MRIFSRYLLSTYEIMYPSRTSFNKITRDEIMREKSRCINEKYNIHTHVRRITKLMKSKIE